MPKTLIKSRYNPKHITRLKPIVPKDNFPPFYLQIYQASNNNYYPELDLLYTISFYVW